MSSFICEECGAKIVDSPKGYIKGCEHYPVETVQEATPKRGRHIVLDLSDSSSAKEKFGG